jgi:RNA polymerase sigma factor (sigma-70 family)
VANDRNGAVLQQIRTLFRDGISGTLTDGQLLEKFASRHGEAAEGAFAALVERHGPMVLRVCRAVVRDPHEADDAFQATFVVLVEKAGSLRVRDSLGPWLHGVACRIASNARAAAARRHRHERIAAETARTEVPGDRDPGELGPVLHEEIRRLPGRLGAPIVLCYLEGLTHEQVAHRLGWPVGTVRSRLAHGRQLLRERLSRRGLAPAVGALGDACPGWEGSATVPEPLAAATARVAIRVATGRAAGEVPASVILMARGVLTCMALSKVKVAATLVALGLVAAGAGAIARQEVGDRDRPETELLAEIERLERQLGDAKRRLADLRRVDRRPGAETRLHGPPPPAAQRPASSGGDSRPEPAPGIAAGLSPAELPSGPAASTAPIAAGVPGPAMAPGPASTLVALPRHEVLPEGLDRQLGAVERKLDRLLEEFERMRGTGR